MMLDAQLISKGENHDVAARQDRLRSAQISQIYSQSSGGSLAALLGGIVLAAALWFSDPRTGVIAWALCYVVVFMAHLLLVRAFHSAAPVGDEALAWGRWHWVVTTSGSLVWGYAVVFLFPQDVVHLQIYMIIFVGGIVAGAVAIYSPTNEYWTNILVALVPLSGRFFYQGGEYNVTVGALGIMFGIVMGFAGIRTHKLYAELLTIRFEREDLIDDLRKEISWRREVEKDLRETRDELELRVAQRTSDLKKANLELLEEIAERRKAEDALRVSENAYRSLSANIPGIVYRVWPQDNKTRFFGRGLEAITGFAPTDMNFGGISAIHQLIVPEDKDNVALLIKRAMAYDKSFEETYRIRDKTGNIRWCTDHGSSGSSREESSKHFDGVIFDVTDRKRAEDIIRESEEKYRLLVDNAQESIFVAQDGHLKFWNPATLELLGFSSEELVSLPFTHFIHPDDREMVLERHLKRLRNEPPPAVYSFRIVKKDTATLWVQLNSVLVDWEGRPATLNFLTDVTEFKRAADVHVRMERLKAIGDLAAGVAHNFNNLLQVVMAGIELALKDLESGNIIQIKKTLERVRKSSKLGSETVKRLQSFAKIRVDTTFSENKVVDLSEIVRQAVDISRPWWKTNLEKEGIRVAMELNLTDGCLVAGAESELFEVLVNLIKNAAEAVPGGGGIRITTCIIEDQVVLEVQDSGIGISNGDQKRLFEPFWTTKGAVGTGLGLAVSRGIVSSHGGTISVASTVGEGTTFTINLPLAQASSQEAAPSLSTILDLNLRILVIDDTEPLVMLLKDLLAGHGQKALAALSGTEGLALFRDNEVDLVICDLGMPEMNGWEVGKMVRSLCREKGIPKTPFILLTGWGGQFMEPDKIAESGIDGVLEKPVEVSRLFSMIQQIVLGTT